MKISKKLLIPFSLLFFILVTSSCGGDTVITPLCNCNSDQICIGDRCVNPSNDATPPPKTCEDGSPEPCDNK